MSEESKSLSQKEYLKRYLSKDKKEKKKRKKVKISSSSHIKRSVIIDDDDDVGISQVASVNDEEFNLDFLGDEAPQIVGIVDDRPQGQFDSEVWKSIGEEGEDTNESKHVIQQSSSEFLADILEGVGSSYDFSTVEFAKKKEDNVEKSDSDVSVERYSKPKKTVKDKQVSTDICSKNDSDSDVSVDRNRTKVNGNAYKSKATVKQQTQTDHRKHYDDSPYEGKKKDKQCSVKVAYLIPDSKRDSNSDRSSSRHRKSDNERYVQPEVKMYKQYKTNDHSDESPPRSRGNKYERLHENDASRGRTSKTDSDSDLSPPRNDKRTSDYHKFTKYTTKKLRRKPRHDLYSTSSKKTGSPTNKPFQSEREKYLETTLDGKKAGLQSAKLMKEELLKLKEREDRAFQRLDPRLLGQSAAPVMRDRRTGQKRDLEKEQREESAKAEKHAILKNKYDRWGRGLKQVQERAEMLAETAYEMSKPLARYKDDEDLDKYLRAQEREGDPMLEYIRQQQLESHPVDLTVEGGSNLRRVYHGSYMPNRFSIPPGHRWDGVDRSNGYEQKWFEHKNARKAIEEAAYKWSTSDM